MEGRNTSAEGRRRAGELGWALHVSRLCLVQLKTSRLGFIDWLSLPFSALMSRWHLSDSSEKKEPRKKGSDGSSSSANPSGRSLTSTHLAFTSLGQSDLCTSSSSKVSFSTSLGASSPVSGASAATSVVGGPADHHVSDTSNDRDSLNGEHHNETRERGVEELLEGNPRGQGMVGNGNLHHRRAAQRQARME